MAGKKKLKGLFMGLLFSVAALGVALVLCATIGTGFSNKKDPGNDRSYIDGDEIKKAALQTLDKEQIKNVYDESYQSEITKKINILKAQNSCTFEKPLFILNPYGTNVTGMYTYFKTDEASSVEYTVSVTGKDISDFTRTMYTDEEGNVTKTHEGQIIGLIQGMTNTVSIRMKDKEGKFIAEKTYKFEIPNLKTVSQKQLKVTNKKDSKQLTDGLFVVYGYDRRNDDEPRHMLLYDNEGVLRAEIPLNVDNGDVNLKIFDGKLFYASTDTNYALVNSTGLVEHVYDLGEYSSHHDFDYDEVNNRIVILATKIKSKTKQDIILSLGTGTGTIEELINFANFMPDIRKKAVISKNSPDQSRVDWVHFNSVQVVGGQHLILSSRELNSIIRINNYYTTPKIGYIIADKQFYKGTKYSSLVLDKKGSFTSQAGQHSVNYIQDASLEPGEYYLTMYNNNYAQRLSLPKFDLSFYKGAGTQKKDAKNSYYYKYLVNETKGTYKLVEKIKVPYSSIVSNAQEYGKNRIICSGVPGIFGEYDSKGKLISQYKLNKFTYRVIKNTMEGCWFNPSK